jgi:hypothetical protein
MVLYGVLLCAIISISACGKSSDDGTPPAPTLQSTRNAFLNSAQTGTVITSSATGTANVGLDPATNKLVGTMTIISAPATAITAMHIHDGAVGVDGGVVVGLTQASSGVWTVDTAATALTAAQIAKFKAAGFYVNVHTTANPTGEIRGQLMSFTENIQPIFDDHCVVCHRSGGPVGRAAFTGLILTPADSYGTLVNKPAVQSTGMRVLPFNADNSVLYQRTAGIGFASVVGERMPLETPPIDQKDLDLIKTWINMGAMDDNGVAQAPQTPLDRTFTREAFLTSAQTGTTVASSITGSAIFVLDTATKKVTGTMTIIGTPATPITLAHIHDGFVGVDGPPVVTLTSADSVTWTETTNTLTDAQMNKFIAGGYYVNVHTQANSAGEIRGQLVSYKENVQTVFNGRCVFCHEVGGPAAFTGLLLTAADSNGLLVNQLATQPSLSSGVTATGTRVIPFNSTDSVLYKRVTGAPGYTGSKQMPASGNSLSTNDLNTIKIWIDMGALNN